MQLDTRHPGWSAALLLAVCVLVPAATTAADTDAPATTVAVVNGEVITVADLEKRLEDMHGEVVQGQRAAADLEHLLFRVVNDVLIGQEARALGLHEEAPVPDAIERNRRRLAVSILERQEVSGPSRPEEREVSELFDERYRRATFHVLTATDVEGAEAILEALKEGTDIRTVAAEMSIDPYRDTGGLLEGVARKDLQVAIANVVFRLAPNEVVGPVETDLGWSVLVAKEFAPPDPQLFEEVRGSLERLVRQRKAAAIRNSLLQELRSRHSVSVDQELVASIQPIRRPDGRLTAESPGLEKVVARIGDEITLSDEEYAVALERRWRTIPEEEAARAAASIILQTLIDERLLVAEAYSRGYHQLPAVRRALHWLETEMVIPKYLNQVLAAGLEVSEEEKRAYYEEQKDSLRRPPRVRLGQITVPTRERAESVASALRGGSDLGWLAARHSTDGLRERGGLQDWSVVRLNGSPLSAALLEAEPGTTLDPIQQEDGWVVYHVVARKEQGVYAFEEVSGNMREAVFRQKFTKNLDRFIKTARSRSRIEIREEVLAGLQLSGKRAAEEGSGQISGHGGHGGA